MAEEKRKKRLFAIFMAMLAVGVIGTGTILTVQHNAEVAREKERAERESVAESERVAESMSKAQEERMKLLEENKAKEMAEIEKERAKVEEQNQRVIQEREAQKAQVQAQRQVAPAPRDEAPQARPQGQQAPQTQARPTQAPTTTQAPIETYRAGGGGGPAIAGKKVEIPRWVLDTLVKEGLMEKRNGEYVTTGNIIKISKHMHELMKQAGLVP
ncbi:hypothetical protein KG089_02685 [Carnobacteriaceae bacterium zg-ZUI252]|nr:hypothetical protein [Carnobacteriaceae bacterium zg-ZUI252]